MILNDASPNIKIRKAHYSYHPRFLFFNPFFRTELNNSTLSLRARIALPSFAQTPTTSRFSILTYTQLVANKTIDIWINCYI